MQRYIQEYIEKRFKEVASLVKNLDVTSEKDVDVQLTINLTDQENTLIWQERGGLIYEFVRKSEIEYLVKKIQEEQKKYKLRIRMSNDEWISTFNRKANEMIEAKKMKELREILKMVEINR